MNKTQSKKKTVAKAGTKTKPAQPVQHMGPLPKVTYLLGGNALVDLVNMVLERVAPPRLQIAGDVPDNILTQAVHDRRAKEAAQAGTVVSEAQGAVNTVKEAPEILLVCDRLQGRTAELENRLSQLMDKLGPILRQEPAAPPAGDCAKGEGAPLPESTLGQMLWAYGDHVTRLIGMVAELNRRVRL